MLRDTLTQEKIIKASIDLPDSDSLEGLSMRALGGRVGSAAPLSTGTWAARTT